MKRFILTLIVVSFALVSFSQTSIYQIQYTTVAGDGSYPSLYENEVVTTGGIVTAIDLNNKYFISSSNGGPWSGIFVYDHIYGSTLQVGDSIVLTASVKEYYGLTELIDVTELNIISSNNPIPDPVVITTLEASVVEDYESVLVQLNNINAVNGFDEYFEWKANDGSGNCKIANEIFDFSTTDIPIINNYAFSKIMGIVKFSWGEFKVNPRNIEDFTSSENNYIVFAKDSFYINPEEVLVPITLAYLNQNLSISNFTIEIQYDDEVLEYAGYDSQNSISANGSVVDNSSLGTIELNYTGDADFNNMKKLIIISFTPLETATSTIEIQNAAINETNVEFLNPAAIEVKIDAMPIGDTLTVIQMPLLNVPGIVMPGEEMEIICEASSNTTNWNFQLIRKNHEESLSIISSGYDTETEKWNFIVEIPQPEIYEMYDLKVTASNGVEDVSVRSVHLIENESNTFYFAHITDVHLVDHNFWSDGLSESDSTEMEDLREVIKDLNIINPAFILNTGDLINEGELEDFENRRYFTKTHRILREFDIPHYIVAGNHDLGGWVSTPPSQGTARRDWWRFFGWKWLNNPSTDELKYTQDYNFKYGNINFIGLESYDNYDSYKYEIYGETSFIPSQLSWLANTVSDNPNVDAHVAFYHFDFKQELNLSDYGLDMALYGHIHQDNGSLTEEPYNIATDNVCDGSRSYRIIKVENGVLKPQPTLSAGSTGTRFEVDYSNNNSGLNDFVTITITNNHNMDFDDGLLKVYMPKSENGYEVENGILKQIDNSGDLAKCYIKVSISALQETIVKINVEGATNINEVRNETVIQCFPNPFTDYIQFNIESEMKQSLSFFIVDNIGRRITNSKSISVNKGTNIIKWDAINSDGQKVNAGTYFINFSLNNESIKTMKFIKL